MLEVVEKRLAQRLEPRERGLDGLGRADDMRLEDLGRRLDGGELELLLRAEVGVHPALAHPDLGGQVAEGERLDPEGGRELGRGPQDRLTAADPVAADRAGGRRGHYVVCLPRMAAVVDAYLARPVVLFITY